MAKKAPAKPKLVTETVLISSLKLDAHNARLHPDRNLDEIKNSLKRFGQQKPIVVDKNNVVQAGNGTLTAAKALGWKEIAIVRTNLSGAEAKAFALADNRTGELAEWDLDQLQKTLDEIDEAGIKDFNAGFTEEELKALAEDDFEGAHAFKPKAPPKEPEAISEEIAAQYAVVITCKDEAEQARVIEYCEKHGLQYKAPSI